MLVAVLGGAGAVLLLLVLLAIFPPRRAPHFWRHHTRPIRRIVRPGHYRW